MPIIWLNLKNYQTVLFLLAERRSSEKSHSTTFTCVCMSVFLKCIPNLAWCEWLENKILFFCVSPVGKMFRFLYRCVMPSIWNSTGENSVLIFYKMQQRQFANYRRKVPTSITYSIEEKWSTRRNCIRSNPASGIRKLPNKSFVYWKPQSIKRYLWISMIDWNFLKFRHRIGRYT